MLARELQHMKAEVPMLVRDVHPLKSMLVSEVQSSKADWPMLVRLSGKSTIVRDVHPSKAEVPILVTPSGMAKDVAIFPAGYITNVVIVSLYNTPSTEQ